MDRVTSTKYQGAVTDNYEYDASGNLGYHEDKTNNVNYKYYYDISDRLVKTSDDKGNSRQYGYDLNNNASTFTDNIGTSQYVTSYGYDKDNRPKSVDYTRNGTVSNVSYTYDVLGRVQSKTTISGTTTYAVSYTYVPGSEAHSTTNLIATASDTAGNSASYTYDANGNILTAVVNGKNLKYYYNDLNELTRDDTDTLTATPKELTDKNLFAYCDNNPIMRKDNGGDYWQFAIEGVGATGAGLGILWSAVGVSILAELGAITPAGCVVIGTVAVGITVGVCIHYAKTHKKLNGSKAKSNDKHTTVRSGSQKNKAKKDTKFKYKGNKRRGPTDLTP